MTLRLEVVELIADCLRHPETELLDEVSAWRHEDGRPLTVQEVTTLNGAKLGEVRAAVALCMAETEAILTPFN